MAFVATFSHTANILFRGLGFDFAEETDYKKPQQKQILRKHPI